MSTSSTTTDWNKLQHAYGEAGDLPPLLEAIPRLAGNELGEQLGELSQRVLHQGTIYSASAPVVQFLLEGLPKRTNPDDRLLYYFLLAGFADSARLALEMGEAIPCQAGGDPVDGEAIRKVLLDFTPLLLSDLDSTPLIRSLAIDILTTFEEVSPSALDRIRPIAETDQEPYVRYTALHGLHRHHAQIKDWDDLVSHALERETGTGGAAKEIRFLLQFAQIESRRENTIPEAADQIVAAYLNASTSMEIDANAYAPSGWNRKDKFFQAAAWLGPDREIATLTAAVRQAEEPDILLPLLTSLLRKSLEDYRTGWDSYTMKFLNPDGSEPPRSGLVSMALRALWTLLLARLAPTLFRWNLRRRMKKNDTHTRKFEYDHVQGLPPGLPDRLNPLQRAALLACVDNPAVWAFRTNLWQLFRLPDTAQELRQFVEDHG